MCSHECKPIEGRLRGFANADGLAHGVQGAIFIEGLLRGWHHLSMKKGLAENRRKSLCSKQCGKQDLNLHGLAATRPST